MPKRSQKSRDLDWDKVRHEQNPPESGKDRHSAGGNFRVDQRLFCEGIDKIKGNACKNKSCRYWADRRIILNCTLYNGSVENIKTCPERR